MNNGLERYRAATNLINLLSHHGHDVTIPEMHVGPSLVAINLDPGEGKTKVKDIRELAEVIGRALDMESPDLLRVVSSSKYIVLEVPLPEKAQVKLEPAPFLDQETLVQLDMKLPMALGLDPQGKKGFIDLVEQPHLLIGGTTGGGKSTVLSMLIATMIKANSSEELEFVMIDPKLIELTRFNTVAPLRKPVITDMMVASAELSALIDAKNDRYETFLRSECTNIEEYRKKNGKRIPYIVCVIDEAQSFLSLDTVPVEGFDTLQARKQEIARRKEKISDLCRTGRAAGVHLILVTQNPTAELLGDIRANFPSKICLMVASGAASRVILEQTEGKLLMGKGDMLYACPKGKLTRYQSPLLESEGLSSLLAQKKRRSLFRSS